MAGVEQKQDLSPLGESTFFANSFAESALVVLAFGVLASKS